MTLAPSLKTFFLLRVALFLGIVLLIKILTGCRSITSRNVLCISFPAWQLKLHWLIVSVCVCMHMCLHHLVWSAQWQALGRIWTTKERWGKISSPPLCPLARLVCLHPFICCYSNCWQFISCHSGFYKVITLCFHPFRLGVITVDTQIHLVPNILREFLTIEYQFSNLNSLNSLK